jgi:hypothetical protein
MGRADIVRQFGTGIHHGAIPAHTAPSFPVTRVVTDIETDSKSLSCSFSHRESLLNLFKICKKYVDARRAVVRFRSLTVSITTLLLPQEGAMAEVPDYSAGCNYDWLFEQSARRPGTD